MSKSKNRDFKKLILVTIISLFTIRVLILILFGLFLTGSQIATLIVVDPFHHYQIAIVLLTITAIFFKKLKKYLSLLVGIAIGLLIDEHTILFGDVGIKLPYVYLSRSDHLIILMSLIFLSGLWVYLNKRR